MRIYLDFNIIVSLIHQELLFDDLLDNISVKNEKLCIPYSFTHIFEIDNIEIKEKEIRRKKISEYLCFLESLSCCAYLYRELPSNNVLLLNERPIEVYRTITEVGNIKPMFNGMMNLISEEQKNQLRNELGIDRREINNYDPQDVLRHLDAKSSFFMGMSCIEMIEYGVTLHPNGKEFSMHNRFAALFELLDMLGYWSDKYTSKSNVARLWDSSHCYFASFCDYFITNDKRTQNKAKVAYDLYHIKTKVLSSKGA